MTHDYAIAGAGLAGAVTARALAERTGKRILVFDERDHVAGNCFTSRDEDTGVLVHRYGPHIFNSNSDRAWDYLNRFGRVRPFVNRVKAVTPRGVFSLPINLHTINQLYGTCLGPAEAEAMLSALGVLAKDVVHSAAGRREAGGR